MSALHETIQDFPAGIPITEVELISRDAVGGTTSGFSYRSEKQVFPGQRWEISMSFLPMQRSEAADLEAFLRSLRGSAGRFRMGDPYQSLPRGQNLGWPEVNTAEKGSEVFTSQGWFRGVPRQLQKNDFIQIEDHLYSVLEAVDSDENGEAEVRVWPALRKSYGPGETIITENARGVFSLRGSSLTVTRSRLELYGTQLSAVEVP